MKKNYFYLLLISLSLTFCEENKKVSEQLSSFSRFNANNPNEVLLKNCSRAPEVFNIEANKDTLIVTKKGMCLLIESGTFTKGNQVYKGILKLEITEAKTFSEMFLNNLSTATTKDDFLQTQGMFHIAPSDKDISITKGKQILARVPVAKKISNLKFYDGVFVGDELQWTQPKAFVEEEEFGNLIAIDFKTLSLSTGRYSEGDFSKETIALFEDSKYNNTYISTYEFKERLNTLLVYSLYDSDGWEQSMLKENNYDPTTLKDLLSIYLNNTHRNFSDVDREVFEFVKKDINKGHYGAINSAPGYYFNEVKKKYEEYAQLNLTKPISFKNFEIEYPLTLDKIENSKLDSKSKSRLKLAFLSTQKYQGIDENRTETFESLDIVFAEIDSFGWKNCDAQQEDFSKDKIVKEVNFKYKSNELILNTIIFAKEDGVIYHFHGAQDGDFSLSDIFLERMRNNQEYQFVFFRYDGKEGIYYDERDMFVTNKVDCQINLKKISKDEFKQKISQLDKKTVGV